MRGRLFFSYIILFFISQAMTGSTLDSLASRLRLFGERIPQEKVFVHMDNTCYYLGDTIWFAAYTRQTNTDKPSTMSRVLYVELLNQEGYLVERQLVEMKQGRGHGNFVLADTLYGGFYELRAYTRWQLNWGLAEKSHSPYAEDWFYNKKMAKEFYRDYDKLYSRVFPVYDKPLESGDFGRDMTMRPMRRYFKSGMPEPSLQLSLFPEGGHLVVGVPCRVAFEAATETGESANGTVFLLKNKERLRMTDDKGQRVESVRTENRGRGTFIFTPMEGESYEIIFQADGDSTKQGRVTQKIQSVRADGVNVFMQRINSAWQADIHVCGKAAKQPLGMTVMHEGCLQLFQELKSVYEQLVLPDSILPVGVNQLTVFDAEGCIYADRLFFVTRSELTQQTLSINGLKTEYEPFEQVSLEVTAPSLIGRAVGEFSIISLSVRDAVHADNIFDSGNIMTEMLLASEIKGFVPQPDYFFEMDDEEHRQALDLLMMTQGWRRFNWHTMATPKAFELTQPIENPTQVLRGEIYPYDQGLWQDETQTLNGEVPHDILSFRIDNETNKLNTIPTPFEMERTIAEKHIDGDKYRALLLKSTESDSLSAMDEYIGAGQGEIIETVIAQTYARESNAPIGSYKMRAPIATNRFLGKKYIMDKEVLVHAEFVQLGSPAVIGEEKASNSRFRIQAPHFYGNCLFYLSASDTTRWKNQKQHQWIDMDEQVGAEYYVRIEPFYPRFTKPYHHYQMCYRGAPEAVGPEMQFNSKAFETDMKAVTIRAKHNGLRCFNESKPAYTIDAYTAFNDICDAGLSTGLYRGRIHFINGVARCYLGDMGVTNPYLLQPRYDGRDISFAFTARQMNRYNLLCNLDNVYIYTDFQPRNGADSRVTEENVERVVVNLQQLPDEGQRTTYRDRRYILQGFNVADDFYHPNYQRNPPKEGQKDYRRTLYWNPELKLDSNGSAHITFFNNSQKTQICVEANGQAPNGDFLYSGITEIF